MVKLKSEKYVGKVPIDPKSTHAEAKERHEQQGTLEPFRKYLNCAKNTFIRKMLYYRQHGRCPWCGKSLPGYTTETNVHHQNYHHICNFELEEICVYNSVKSRMIRTKVPNCEVCYYYHPVSSESCLDNLLLVHSDCHSLIHGIEQ